MSVEAFERRSASERPGATERAGVRRQRIVAAAVALADAEGLGAVSMQRLADSLSAVEMLGVDLKTGGTVLMAVDDYVIGHCLRRRARERMMAALKAAGPEGELPGHDLVSDPEVTAAIEAGELPRLCLAFGRRGKRGPLGVPPKVDFDQGLEWLLDGIEAMTKD